MALGHHASNKLMTKTTGDKAPLVTWEPYFCVLLQDEQTFTAYRSEEMAVSLTFQLPYLVKPKCSLVESVAIGKLDWTASVRAASLNSNKRGRDKC